MSAESNSETSDPILGIASQRWDLSRVLEITLLVGIFYIYAGDPAPGVNEAHYLVKAKNYWNPSFCSGDLFTSSGKAHTTFYFLFGWPTQFLSLEATAWIGRSVGWLLLAFGLQRLAWTFTAVRWSSLPLAVIWIAGLEHGNLAGEWVVGGIEAKVPAYGLVLVALSDMLRRRWNLVWIWLGGAAAFHVLTGGWSVIAGTLVFWITENGTFQTRLKKFFSWGLFVGGGLALFGLVPAFQLTASASPEQSTAAAWIYVYRRIGHHLLPAEFRWDWYVRHGVLIVMLLIVRRGCRGAAAVRLSWFGIGAIAIAGMGMIIGCLPTVAPDLAAKLLRFYWFRLADAIVPLTVGCLMVQTMTRQWTTVVDSGSNQPIRSQETKPAFVLSVLSILTLVVALALFCTSSWHRARLAVPPSASHRLLGREMNATGERQRQTYADWLAVCRWIELATPQDEIFLTPRHQQSFKWYAGRSEVVNWKDVPQDAASLIEWERRFDEVFPSHEGRNPLGRIRVTIRYSRLKEFRQRYNVRFMVVDRRVIPGGHLPLVRLYPTKKHANRTYAVYELPHL